MKIGDEIISVGQRRDEEEPFEYRSKIVDMETDCLYIDYPINPKTDRTVFIPLNEPFNVRFFKETAVFQFKTHVVERTKRVVPVLKIVVPSKEKFKKIQRRAYLRVNTAVDIAIHCPEESFPPFTTLTKDLSGGGARFIVPYHLSRLDFEKEQLIKTYFVLRFSSDKYEYIEADAKVVRMLGEKEPKEVSIQFQIDDIKDEQKIVQYCFHIEREERRQTL